MQNICVNNIDHESNRYNHTRMMRIIIFSFVLIVSLFFNLLKSDKVNAATVEDNWLNREVARQVFGNENRYGELTQANFNSIVKIDFCDKNSIKNPTGPIPNDINKLINLKHLCIKGEKITGVIPSSLYDLKNLEILSISSTGISGVISKDIGKLVKLKTFWLQLNNFTGELPDELWELQYIEEIKVIAEGITGNIENKISKAKRLKILWITATYMSGNILENIDINKNLVEIQIASDAPQGRAQWVLYY